MFNEIEFLDKLYLSTLNLKDFLRWALEARCEAAVKFAETVREKVRRHDNCALSLYELLSLSHKYVPVELGEVGWSKYVRCYEQRLRKHYSAKRRRSCMTGFVRCSRIGNCPLDICTWLATCRRPWT